MKLDGEGIVPNRVNVVDSRPVRPAPGPTVGKKAQELAASQGHPGSAGIDVQITGTARNLAALEQQLRELPPVDEGRVAAVRQRLDEGSYHIDAGRVANRLLALEQELGRLK